MKTLALIVSAVIALAAEAGCAAYPDSTRPPQPSVKDISAMMTPEQAKQEVRSLYEATRALMAGEWIDDTRTWGICTMANGDEGTYYDFFSLRRAQTLPTDPKTTVEQVQQVWARHGHPVEIEFDETLTPPRYILSEPVWMGGSGPDGLLLQFTVGDEYANFIATSRCVAGDSLELSLSE